MILMIMVMVVMMKMMTIPVDKLSLQVAKGRKKPWVPNQPTVGALAGPENHLVPTNI